MLETIREYALDRLEAEQETAHLRDRHLIWCTGRAGQAADDIAGADQAEWLNRLESEHDNMRAAMRWSEQHGDTDGRGLHLASSLGRNFWAMRGYHREGRAWLNRLLAHAPRRSGERAEALRTAGRLALRQNDYPSASALFDEALAIFREIGDRRGIAQTLSWYGVVPHHLGQHDAAQAMLEESLTISREIGIVSEQSIALRFLADLAQDRGDYPRAALRYEETLALSRPRQVPHDIAYALRGLGHLARAQGRYARADALLRESLTLLKPLNDRRCIPLTLEGLACITVGDGWAERAARLLGAAHAMQAKTGAPSPPSSAADYQRTVMDARKALGDDRFEQTWAEGSAMGLDEAVDLALAQPWQTVRDPAHSTTSAVIGRPRQPDVPLSPREREVVTLIAQGLSNREIAESLVLSVRTVERHIENVYNRLGISGKAGRAIVTAYVLRHGIAAPA
jgi:non-specific serine/threonine protein kinase